jgi:hypothetical protein
MEREFFITDPISKEYNLYDCLDNTKVIPYLGDTF